jgi:adenylate cyclase
VRVERCFGFVDLCGFTAFTERFGDELAVVALASFRTTLREVAARRGVRITKWLGDGAMLSSPDTEATVAMVLEVAAGADAMLAPARSAAAGATPGKGKRLKAHATEAASANGAGSPATPASANGTSATSPDHAREDRLALRAGLARGPVVMFEGDDYIGRPTNVASRLCDVAMPGQVLATREVAALAPCWVAASEALTYYVRGFERPLEAVRIQAATSADMVKDPVCKLVLPLVSGLVTRRGGEGALEYFCSTACALAWEQAQAASPTAAFPF